ncbi:nuclease Fan1 [soil metagenome]
MNPLQDRPYYYLENFEIALAWIRQRHDDLLSDEERTFVAEFSSLPCASKALLVRMLMRKGDLFRESRLNYPEIGVTAVAASALIERAWIDADPTLNIEQIFSLLTKPEIVALFKLTHHRKAMRKCDQLAELSIEFAEARPFSRWHAAANESVFHVRVCDLCDRLRLIFFGNLLQDWTAFVLSDLGVFRYEKVELPAQSRGFQSRRDIDDYLQLYQCRERSRAGESPESVLADLPATCSNSWLNARREKFLFRIAQQFESMRRWSCALEIHARCSFPGARVRAIRVLERCGHVEAAWQLASTAQSAPESEGEAQQLTRILPRLVRKLGKPAPKKNRSSSSTEVAQIVLSLPMEDSLSSSVEEIVRAHLEGREQAEALQQSPGFASSRAVGTTSAPVFYVENTLLNSLFGLLCWEAVFAPVPGAFFHPFHSGPADLHSADFHLRRKAQFADCLSQLDSNRYQSTVLKNFQLKYGTLSPFVAWEYLSEELLDLALHCIPAAHLKKCFERILLDIPTNRSGLPDLIQFWPKEQRYRMIEVKGPGDRLQDNQIRWIKFCLGHGIPVEVCYVQWMEKSA